SLRAVLKALDPHSAVVTGDDLRRGVGREDNYGVGVDLEDKVGPGPLFIKNVLPGSPAQKAGIRPGDEITHIDGKPVKEATSVMALQLLNGQIREVEFKQGLAPPGGTDSTPAEVTVLPKGEKVARKVTLERSEFRAETVLGVRRKDDNAWDYFIDREKK